MKPFRLNILIVTMLFCNSLFSQKKMTDGTIVYDVVIEKEGKAPELTNAFKGAVTTIYLSGTKSRTDMVSSLGAESTIYNAETGKAVILKEYSGQKLMITLTKENWVEKNSNFNDINFEFTSETKVIAGYTCKKATAKLKDGKLYTVFYATTLSTGKADYNPLFANLPGIVMEYEINMGKTKFKYSLATINFDAVSSVRFDIPKAGYRVMTYEENKQIKKME
jgi:GLPGLI family protein